MAEIIIPALLGAVVFPAFLYYFETHKKNTLSLIAKTVSSLTFVLLGFICSKHSTLADFSEAFLIGEIFGAIGDIIINLRPWVKKHNITLCAGGVSFFIGHIFYVTAVAGINTEGVYLSVILTLAVYAAVIILLSRLTDMGKTMFGLICAYMLIVSYFFASSLSAFILQPLLGRGLLTLGSFLFLFSDLDNMLQNFGKKKSKFIFNCMYVYYPAQIIIALSLYWFV